MEDCVIAAKASWFCAMESLDLVAMAVIAAVRALISSDIVEAGGVV